MKMLMKIKMMREILKFWQLVMNKMTRHFTISQPYLSKLFMNFMKHVKSVLCTVRETIPWLEWRLESIMVFTPNQPLPKVFLIEPPLNYLESLSTLQQFSLSLWWSSHFQVKNKWSILLSRMFFTSVVLLISKTKLW